MVPDALRKAWVAHVKRNNRNGHQAVQEAAQFLQFNKVSITKELLGAIQDRADLEWCMQEPSRCPKTAKAHGGRLVRQAHEEEVQVVVKAVRAVHGGGVIRKTGRRCCGG